MGALALPRVYILYSPPGSSFRSGDGVTNTCHWCKDGYNTVMQTRDAITERADRYRKEVHKLFEEYDNIVPWNDDNKMLRRNRLMVINELAFRIEELEWVLGEDLW